MGWLNAISANCLGAAIGAIIGGFMADRYGRKAIYTYNMLIYMLGVLVVVLSTNFPMLLLGFMITGISVGVGVPASWTYISESSETNNRGRNIGISQMAWGIGPFIILVLGFLLAPASVKTGDEGGLLFPFVRGVAALFYDLKTVSPEELSVFSSRIVFLSLFVVAFVAWLLQRQLQESASWQKAKEDREKAQGAAKATGKQASQGAMSGVKALFTNKVNLRTMLFLAGMYLSWNLVSSVMGMFQPHIYESAGGLSNQGANLLAASQWIVIILATFAFAMLVDKMNQRLLYFVGVSMGVLAWLIITSIGITSTSGLLLFTLLWGLQGGISVQGFYALWASELFPAKYRAAAQGVMFFLVRGLSAVWGIVFVYIYGENGEGFTTAAYVMMALVIISLLIGTIWTPKTRGKSLEEITKERYGDSTK